MNKLIDFIKSFFKNSHYVSPLDEFLKNYDASHPRLSQSQQTECKIFKRIYQLRDNKIVVQQKTTLWDKF